MKRPSDKTLIMLMHCGIIVGLAVLTFSLAGRGYEVTPPPSGHGQSVVRATEAERLARDLRRAWEMDQIKSQSHEIERMDHAELCRG